MKKPCLTVALTVALTLVCALLAPPVQAHNGTAGICLPVHGITIDGDLSDWPDDLPRYPIRVQEGGMLTDPNDLEASFQMGFDLDENAIYIAIDVVQDESTVIDTSVAGRYDYQDGTDVRVNLGHAVGDSTGVHHYGFWGTNLQAWKKGKLADVTAAVSRRRRNGHQYEWRIDLTELSEGEFQLTNRSVIGLGVAVMDVDEDGIPSYVTWGPLKGGQAYDFNSDAIILSDPHQAGSLSGRVRWDEQSITGPSTLAIESTQSQVLHIDLKTDDSGDFAIDVPAGEYRIHLVEGDGGQDRIIELAPGDSLQFDLLRSLQMGRSGATAGRDSIAAGPGDHQGLWHTFGASDGLPGFVYALAQDHDGALWIGTNGGLFRYDGEFFTRISDFGIITSLTVDGDGDVWFAGSSLRYSNGLGYWDGEQVTRYNLPNKVNDIHLAADGSLWVGTSGGVSRWLEGRLQPVPGLTNLRVTDIIDDVEGGLLVAHVGGLRRWIDDDHVEDLPAEHSPGEVPSHMLVDRHERTWLATRTVTPDYRRGPEGQLRVLGGTLPQPLLAVLGHTPVNVLLEDREGVMWIATTGRGLLSWNGQEVVAHTGQDGLGSNWAISLLQDREGHLWVGTTNGLSRYDGNHLYSLGVADGLSGSWIRNMVEGQDGDLWFATDQGLDRYDGTAVTNVNTNRSIVDAQIPDLVVDTAGGIWIASGQGVTRYDDDHSRSWGVADGLVHRKVIDLLASSDGSVWVVPEVGGVQRITDDRIETWTTEDGLPHERVTSVEQDLIGRVWFGTPRGLARMDDGRITSYDVDENGIFSLRADARGRLWGVWAAPTWNQLGVLLMEDSTLRTWGPEEGLPVDYLYLKRGAMLTDAHGDFWFSAGAGLVHINDEGLQVIGLDDGLPSEQIRAFSEDKGGVLWIGTNDGLSRYDGRVFRTLTRRDGLVQNFVNRILQAKNGDMWVATDGGVTRVRPRLTPPAVRIVSVLADRNYGAADTVRVPASQSTVRFEFRGRSLYTPTQRMVYLYQLVGVDDDWRQTPETAVEYTDLPSGPLRFQVQAVDLDLNYSELATVDLELQPSYTLVFLYSGLGLSLFGVVLASGYALRARQAQSQALQERNTALEATNQHLREMDELKSDFVSNVSHELRTPLTSIKGSVDNMLDGITGEINDKQARYLGRVQGNANRLSRLVDDLLDLSRIEAGRLELRPTNVDVAQIGRDVVANLQTLAADKQITLAIDTNGEATAWADADRVHQVLVNLVGNAVKFTPDGGQVDVRVSGDTDEVSAAVSDTGPGIEEEQRLTIFDKFHQVGQGTDRQGAGLGLAISQRLVELHGGSLHVDSEIGAGSTFTFTLPVHANGAEGD
jgi:signal transduction histidine kinase/ligand-binding sensor domain-containing protein